MAIRFATHKNDNRVQRLVAASGIQQGIYREDLRSVLEMIEQGDADVNSRATLHNSGGWTPLILATSKRDKESVGWLLGAGANPNIAENDGWVPLFFAIFSNDPELCRILLDAGTNLNYRLPDGKSALDLARERGKQEIIEMITQYQDAFHRKEDPPMRNEEKVPEFVEVFSEEKENQADLVKLEELKQQHRRHPQEPTREVYVEEDVRYEDVEQAEPEGLLDRVLTFLGF